jgi:hypothetical protein
LVGAPKRLTFFSRHLEPLPNRFPGPSFKPSLQLGAWRRFPLPEETRLAKQISLQASSFAGGDLIEKPFELVDTASSLPEKAPDPVEKSGDPVEKPAGPTDRGLFLPEKPAGPVEKSGDPAPKPADPMGQPLFLPGKRPSHQSEDDDPVRKPPVQ